jgi:hypothetical protein
MIERDPQAIYSDEGKPIEMAFSVTHGRVQHYSDVVEHIVNTEVARCHTEGFRPTKQQVDFLRKEIIRYAVIRREIEAAQKIRIKRSNLLNETIDSSRTR